MPRLRVNTFVTAVAILLSITVGANLASAAVTKDPRVCASGSPAKNCAESHAVADLRLTMARRTQVAHWDAQIQCTGNQAWLRWRCTFRNAAGKGSAVILLGSKPKWVPVVTITNYTPA